MLFAARSHSKVTLPGPRRGRDTGRTEEYNVAPKDRKVWDGLLSRVVEGMDERKTNEAVIYLMDHQQKALFQPFMRNERQPEETKTSVTSILTILYRDFR